MPLPDSAPLSLVVSSNAIQSKPKRAMVVRMSAETLDALADAHPNHPPVSFDLGDNPGIYIGDAFFPMRSQKESSPHELYLRATSSAKPMAPLKLYANIIGKFMVERQLGVKVTDKVRQQTMVAKLHHMERQAILLDQPPIPVSGSKNKRKIPGSGTVVKKALAADQLRTASPSTAATRKVSPLPPNPPSSRANADVRRRLVHCLAILPRLSEDAVRMVGGANISASARQDLVTLLDEVAEQQAPLKKGDKSPRPWMLKTQTWTEIRPYEWPKLTEAERTNMARQARMAFKALKIPESDPAWDNVRYRPTAPAIPTDVPPPPPMAASNSGRSSTSTQAETKRAVITKEAKQKSKHDSQRPKGEIQMKDESTKVMSRVNTIKREDPERSSTPSEGSAAKSMASRRLPGSGYQVKKSPQPSAGPGERSGTPVDGRSPQKSSSALPPSVSQKPSPPTGGSHAKKTIPAVAPKVKDETERERERQLERQKERERAKREREKEKQQEERERERERMEVEKREKARQKEEREIMEREKRQREKEREEEKRQRAKEREQEEMELERRRKERIMKEKAATGATPPFKRKLATADTQETYDSSSKLIAQKRRKLDDGSIVSSSQTREAGSKRPAYEPTSDPRLKTKKNPSPQTSERWATASAGGSTHKSERPSKTNGSSKSRQPPVYTSSEDDGEIPQPRKRHPSPPPISDRSNSSDQPPSERVPPLHRTPHSAYPPATDHAALRALYQGQYASYLMSFSKVVAQKRKIEAMLNGDSDAEMDVMDLDDLMKLSHEHRSLKTDLENIHDLYTNGAIKASGNGSTSD